MAGHARRIPGSGVLGEAGRVPAQDPAPLRSSGLRLAGSPLPLVGTARIYVCGITPYDVTHLGHAATFVWADTLAAVVRAAGVDSQVVRNVTDVDDVLTDAAGRRGLPYDELALTGEFTFERDMAALGVQRVDGAPRARAHVGQVVELAAALLATGAAYERDGEVWLRGAEIAEASGLDLEEAARLSREFGEDSAGGAGQDRWDVPVWRRSGPDHPAWPSPWGWGRPGWHAECAAMAWSSLGAGVDVLVGGADLAWPHHAYQAAMVERATGVAPFARTRMHVGTVAYEGAKMAKSTGNLVLVEDLVARTSGAAVRLLLLDRAWAEAWTYEPAMLDAAAQRLQRLYAAAGRSAGTATGASAEAAPPQETEARGAVLDLLLADLDVAGALDLAEREGGAYARAALSLLRLG